MWLPLLIAFQLAFLARRSLLVKVSLNLCAFAALLCDGGFSTMLSSFLAFETNVISLGFYVRLSKIPPRFRPSGRNQQDSHYDHRRNDDHNNHNR